MKKLFTLIIAQIVAVAAVAQPQTLTITDILRGDKVPTFMKFDEMGQDFRAVKLGSKDSAANPFSMFMPIMMMGLMSTLGAPTSNTRDVLGFSLLGLADVSWTKGDIVQFASGEFLVTYKLPIGMTELMQLGSPGGDPSKLLSELKLSLVKLTSIESLTPAPEITKETISKLAESLKTIGQEAVPSQEAPAEVESGAIAAWKSTTLSNAKQLALATHMFLTDNKDIFPYVQGTKAMIKMIHPYLKMTQIWETKNPNGGQLQFNMCLAGANISDVLEPSSTPLFYDSVPWPAGYRVVAFVDGHAKTVSEEDWSTMQPLLNLKLKKYGKPLPMDFGNDLPPPD